MAKKTSQMQNNYTARPEGVSDKLFGKIRKGRDDF